MAPPGKMLWPLEPHTKGKHLVLRSYLDAWLPILGSRSGRILFVDGFAGPGEYQDGEEGSPQIALRALVDHSAKRAISAEIGFVFIEADTARAAHLANIVDAWKGKLPGKCWTKVINAKFDEALGDFLGNIDVQNARLAPTFLMIDPFGVSGTPMEIIARVLKNPRCEVYVSLMYESINRFANTSEFVSHLDVLFGTQEWRGCSSIEKSELRRNCFFELYEQQLRISGAKYVVHFDLYAENRFIYSIFFATKNLLGCDRMKAAIWKLAPGGEFEFRGTHTNQLALGLDHRDFGPLIKSLLGRIGGKDWVPVKRLIEFMKSDETDYFSGQLRQHALIPLENEGKIEIDESSRKRKRAFPDGCMIRFP